MILTGLELAGVGRFRTPVRLGGLATGVNVLAAPNETGKSTLFRAVKACLFQRYTASGSEVESLATHGAELPMRIAVEFRRAGREYRIDKTFLRSRRAVLTEDGVEIARDRAADDRLWDVLGLGYGRGNVDDTAAFGILWVGQRQSLKLDPPSHAAVGALNRMIAAEIGEIVGGERARTVLAKVTASLHELETPKTAVPRGAWKAALDRREAARSREGELKALLDALEDDFRALAAARAEQARHQDPAIRGRLVAELAAARAEHEAARAAGEALRRCELEAKAAESTRERIADRLAHLTEAAGQIAGSRQRMADLEGGIAERSQALDHARRVERDEADAVADAERALADLARERESLERLATALDAAERLQDWTARRDEALAVRQRLGEIRRELAAVQVTPEVVAAAARLDQQITKLRLQRESAAPRLAIRLADVPGRPVTLDGTVLLADEHRPVLDPVTIAIEGVATVAITPAGSGTERVEIAEAERRLAEILAKAGVASLGAAQQALARADRLRHEDGEHRQRLAALPKGRDGEDGLERLQNLIARAETAVASALAETGTGDLPSPFALAGRREALAGREQACQAQRRAAASRLDRSREASIRLSADLGAARTLLQREAQTLASALAAAPDDTREADLARLQRDLVEARAVAEVAEAAAARQRAAVPSPEALSLLGARVERLEQALAQHDLQVQEFERKIDMLEVGIQKSGGLGLGEEHAAALADLDEAERDLARQEEEVETLRLLRRSIEDSLSESRERYLAPVRRHVRPFLNAVFPGADLDFAEDFTPAGLHRAGEAERHDLLSDGTREQIAVLVRLALGAMLAAQGEAIPVILDDALVFSDDARIERMFDALAWAAERQQVIVLTCRHNAFRSLGGTMLRLERL